MHACTGCADAKRCCTCKCGDPCHLQDARAFLTDFRSGYYEHTKLANVLFGYELQRRLGVHGVTSCVADPGGVRSNIWDKSPIFKKGIKK